MQQRATLFECDIELLIVDDTGNVVWQKTLPGRVDLTAPETDLQIGLVTFKPIENQKFRVKAPYDGAFYFQQHINDVIYKRQGPIHVLAGEPIDILTVNL